MSTMSTIRGPVRTLAVAVLLTVMAAACGGEEGSTPKTSSGSTAGGPRLAELREAGVIKAAVANEPPYTELTPAGELRGMVPDVVEAVMAELGVPKVEPVVTSYESMISGLQANKWDLVAAGLGQTAERCGQVLFTHPDTADGESFLVPAGNPKNIEGYADIAADPSLTLAVVPGTAQDVAAKNAGAAKKQLVDFPDLLSMVEAVKAGRVSATASPGLSVTSLKETVLGDLEVVPATDGGVFITGIAFRTEDAQLRDAFDEVLARFKEDGTYAKLAEKYGFDAELIIALTDEDVPEECRH